MSRSDSPPMNRKPLQDHIAKWNDARNAGDVEAICAATNALIDLATELRDDRDRVAAISAVAALADDEDETKLTEALAKLASYPRIAPAPAPVPPIELQALETVDDPRPEPVIWRESMQGSWLARGEVAVLSGGGGGGKSTLALQWALAAARNELHGGDQGPVAGCRVAGGTVAYISWEDRRRRIKDRADKIVQDWHDSPTNLIWVAEGVGPIFGPPPDTPLFNARPVPLPSWDELWQAIRDIHEQQAGDLSLVVLDPVMSAFAGDSSRVEAVRLFLDALRAEAEALNCGILLIAHSTKTGRAGTDETGAVAGSAAWHDAARGVVTLGRPKTDGPDILACVKANYGPRWQMRLNPKPCRDKFAWWDDGGKYVPPDAGSKDGGQQNKRARAATANNQRKTGKVKGID